MPLMDGISMTKEILSFLPDVSFIFISCFDDFKFAQDAIALGVYRYILKPIDIDELSECIVFIKEKIWENKRKELLARNLNKQIKAGLTELNENFFIDITDDIRRIYKSDDISLIRSFIEKYCPDEKAVNGIPGKILGYYIITSVNALFSEQNIDFSHIFNNDFSILEKIMRTKDIVNLKQWIENVLRFTKDYSKNQKMLQYEKIVNEIKRNIDCNYAGIHSVEQAIEPVFISLSNGRKIFKRITGVTIFDYLLKTRMENAKKLFLNKNLKIYDVGQKVGYDNASYFINAFKQYAGMTPQEYRVNLKGTGGRHIEVNKP
jgi:two-component system response regulator YesN